MTTFLPVNGIKLLLLITVAGSSAVHAQSAVGGSKQVAELYTQMQQLQREVMELRGVVEEQAYRLRKLERQRLADYQSLDQRLRAMSEGAEVKKAAVKAPATSNTRGAPTVTSTGQVALAEDEAYKQAFSLLKKQQLTEAEGAFEKYQKNYPNGKYSGNVFYWLGELNLSQDDLAASREAFGSLIKRYPKHRKAPEATYKLAVIHQRNGQSAEAKALLNKIVNEYSAQSPTTVNKANMYLDKHFSP